MAAPGCNGTEGNPTHRREAGDTSVPEPSPGHPVHWSCGHCWGYDYEMKDGKYVLDPDGYPKAQRFEVSIDETYCSETDPAERDPSFLLQCITDMPCGCDPCEPATACAPTHAQPDAGETSPDASEPADGSAPTNWICYCHAPDVAVTCIDGEPICATEDPSDDATRAHCTGSDAGADCFCTCGPAPTLSGKRACKLDTCFGAHPSAT